MTLRRVNDPVSAGAFIAFDSLHDGMLYCEQQYLQVRQTNMAYRSAPQLHMRCTGW